MFTPGDLILELAGQPISEVDDLHRVSSDETPGRSLEMCVLRHVKLERLRVTPGLPSAVRSGGR